jgi:hypothetical protein
MLITLLFLSGKYGENPRFPFLSKLQELHSYSNYLPWDVGSMENGWPELGRRCSGHTYGTRSYIALHKGSVTRGYSQKVPTPQNYKSASQDDKPSAFMLFLHQKL